MKIIHCADLHLDSRLNTHFTTEQAAARREELLDNFQRLVDYALQNGVSVILIAGDLFDSEEISLHAVQTVCRTILDAPSIAFFYLTGNHEQQGFIRKLVQLPKNLKLFRDRLTSYRFHGGSVTISGMNPGPGYREELYRELNLPQDSYNILMLHGQLAGGAATNGQEERIDLRALSHRNIDYLALGHVHSHMEGRLDARGAYVYPGCLEGRGYDECGEHGFVLLEVDPETHTAKHEFIPFAQRRIEEVTVELHGTETTPQLLDRIREALLIAGCGIGDMAGVRLTGQAGPDCQTAPGVLGKALLGEYYDLKLTDETIKLRQEEMLQSGPDVPGEGRDDAGAGDYRQDKTLKGEFVRLVSEDETLSEEDRKAILQYGLAALLGEEVLP